MVIGSTQYGRACASPRRCPRRFATTASLARHGDLVYRVDPYKPGKGPVEFNFDWSFDYYPMAYERPGPTVLVYRLRGAPAATPESTAGELSNGAAVHPVSEEARPGRSAVRELTPTDDRPGSPPHRRAIELAEHGRGHTSPNPLVGAVIVRDGEVLGEGYHAAYGAPHAEVSALAACEQDPIGATMYVTLEPCCHQGQTPPCTDAIVKAGIKTRGRRLRRSRPRRRRGAVSASCATRG